MNITLQRSVGILVSAGLDAPVTVVHWQTEGGKVMGTAVKMEPLDVAVSSAKCQIITHWTFKNIHMFVCINTLLY